MAAQSPTETVRIGKSPAIAGIEMVRAAQIRFAMPPRISSDAKIIYVARGVRRFRYCNTTRIAGAGSLLFLPPETVHASEAEGGQSATVYVLSLPPALSNSAPSHLEPITGRFSTDPAFRRAFWRLSRPPF